MKDQSEIDDFFSSVGSATAASLGQAPLDRNSEQYD